MRAKPITRTSTEKITKPISLGLSLSYGIVKAHRDVPIAIGMKVETKEVEGSEFIHFVAWLIWVVPMAPGHSLGLYHGLKSVVTKCAEPTAL